MVIGCHSAMPAPPFDWFFLVHMQRGVKTCDHMQNTQPHQPHRDKSDSCAQSSKTLLTVLGELPGGEASKSAGEHSGRCPIYPSIPLLHRM